MYLMNSNLFPIASKKSPVGGLSKVEAIDTIDELFTQICLSKEQGTALIAFAICDQDARPYKMKELERRLNKREINVENYRLSSDAFKEDQFFQTLCEKHNSSPYFLEGDDLFIPKGEPFLVPDGYENAYRVMNCINFSREPIARSKNVLVFWVNKNTLASFATYCADLYSRGSYNFL
jgi:hypothetical protein